MLRWAFASAALAVLLPVAPTTGFLVLLGFTGSTPSSGAELLLRSSRWAWAEPSRLPGGGRCREESQGGDLVSLDGA
jgi:hypothetical protein